MPCDRPHPKQPSPRGLVVCPDCQAEPDGGDVRTITVGQDMAVTEI